MQAEKLKDQLRRGIFDVAVAVALGRLGVALDAQLIYIYD
jgi:hypothetical protein